MLLLVFNNEGGLGGILISLPLNLFEFFLAGFLISFALAQSESCQLLNEAGA